VEKVCYIEHIKATTTRPSKVKENKMNTYTITIWNNEVVEFTTAKPEVSFNYVVDIEGGERIVGRGYTTESQARAALLAQMRKTDRLEVAAAGMMREAVAA
jgi:hypothetical protein